MHTSAPEWFPLPTLLPLVGWSVEADGTYSSFSGPATVVAPMDPSTIPGRHYRDVTEQMPEVRAVIERALAGDPFTYDEVEAWGRRWFLWAQPEYGPRGQVLRARGTALLLPAGAARARPEVGEVYLFTQPVRVPWGATIRPGAVMARDEDGWTISRKVPDAAGLAILQRHSSAVERIDEHAESPPAPVVRSASPPRLSVVP